MSLRTTTVVIAVGGKGTRLGLGPLPKPMVDIEGVPLLQRTVTNLAEQGVRHFIFLAGYGASYIADHFDDEQCCGATIDIIEEPVPLGTAGGFDLIRERLTEPFLVGYGDVLFDVDIARFSSWTLQRGGLGALYAHPNDHPFDSDLLEVGDDADIVRFVSKSHEDVDCGNLVNAAFYCLSPEILTFIPRGVNQVLDWGRDVFPQVVKSGGRLFAYRGTEYLKDIGTPDRLARARDDFASGRAAKRSYRHKQRAIFLDRDGVLNREVDGVLRPDMLELMPDAADSVKRINMSEFLAICVTNQPAVAKGFMTFDDLKRVHWRLDADLAQSGAFLDDLFFCPHHPERGFANEVPALKIDCGCRKPKPGMLLAAAERHNIDLRHSYLIGDDIRDIGAAAAAGTASFLVGGKKYPDIKSAGLARDGAYRFEECATLACAVDAIFSRERPTT